VYYDGSSFVVVGDVTELVEKEINLFPISPCSTQSNWMPFQNFFSRNSLLSFANSGRLRSLDIG